RLIQGTAIEQIVVVTRDDEARARLRDVFPTGDLQRRLAGEHRSSTATEDLLPDRCGGTGSGHEGVVRLPRSTSSDGRKPSTSASRIGTHRSTLALSADAKTMLAA